MGKRHKKFFFLTTSAFFLFFIFIPEYMPRNEFPVFRVVIDPGHGGVKIQPRLKHGDRYDPVSGTYLDDYRPGAALTVRGNKIKEHNIAYSIGQKTLKILQYTAPGADFGKFERIAKKYGLLAKRINIISITSRPGGLSENPDTAQETGDVNGPYRIFDYPDSRGSMAYGRISKINSFKPHIVVSIHLAESAPSDYKAVNTILAPSFSHLLNGLYYLRGNKTGRSFFNNSYMKDWFVEDEARTPFSWFLSDISQYFTGYPLDENRKIIQNNFRGYRHNMIHWAYMDEPGWEKDAAVHAGYSRYSMNYKDVSPAGKFWDRERSVYESYRRDGGMEGFGGDNAYASYEIIRYILYSLKKNGRSGDKLTQGKPYVSIWTLPIYLNAINAYFELGYLRRKTDRKIFLENQNEIAEGIAVGVYSLLAGIDMPKDDFTHMPKGKRIDLERYDVSSEKSYFDAVWDN